jgi:glycosyltransferase involved in cell wall biosynthesis
VPLTAHDVSVVIPAHNAAPCIEQQLEALVADGAASVREVIVVDHDSDDATREVVDRFRGRLPVTVVTAIAGGGPARPRNVGIGLASSDVVLMVDADDRVRPGWIDAMIEALERAPVVGARLALRHDLNPGDVATSRTVSQAEALPEFLGVPFSLTAGMGLRRYVWEAIGGFDEAMFVGEDCDFGLRAARAGFPTIYVPDAVVDFRLRSDLASALRQGWDAGRAEPLLLVRHGTKIDRRSWWIRVVLIEGARAAGLVVRELLRVVVHGSTQGARLAVARRTGRAIGRVVGAVTARCRPW